MRAFSGERRAEESHPIARKSTAGPRAGFERFDLARPLLRALDAAGFTEPRPIQAQGLRPALRGRDLLGLAQTGTGKTAAFVLPILQRLLAKDRPGPRALVVTPTRELAAQVQAEFERLARFTSLTSTAIYGGVKPNKQEKALRQSPDVLVACPGRLLDLENQGIVRLDRVEVLVLDEADHMFDMGFLPDVRRILRALPERRQNLLFSATMPREIRKLADRVLYKPEVIELSHSKPAETIDHFLCPVHEKAKSAALERLLDEGEFRSAIVFLRTKRRAKRLAEQLTKRGHNAVALQGNMSQSQRDRALEGFRDGTYDVLVATDIAARGLDIAGVSHVVNFDVPNTPDAYTHRIGRTGRSGLVGSAFTLVTHEDTSAVRAIEKYLGKRVPLHELGELAPVGEPLNARRRSGGGGRRQPQGQKKAAGGASSSAVRRKPKSKSGKKKARQRAAAAQSPRPAQDGGRPKRPAKRKEPSSAPFGQGID